MQTVRAIVLGRKERGEADYLVYFFTDALGLMRAIAPGVRKKGAKLRGHLEPGSETEISFVPGKAGYKLTGANVSHSAERLREDLRRQKLFLAAALILEKISFPGEEGAVWQALKEFHSWLDSAEVEKDLLVFGFLWFLVRLLGESGYQLSKEEGALSNRGIRKFVENCEKFTLEEVLKAERAHFEPETIFAPIRQSFIRHFGYRFLFLSKSLGDEPRLL